MSLVLVYKARLDPYLTRACATHIQSTSTPRNYYPSRTLYTSTRQYSKMPTQYNVRPLAQGDLRKQSIEANETQVTLKPDASPEDFEQAKKDVESKGGKITHEFKLIKGFTYVPRLSLPAPMLMSMTVPSSQTTSSPPLSQTTKSPLRRTLKLLPSRPQYHDDEMMEWT